MYLNSKESESNLTQPTPTMAAVHAEIGKQSMAQEEDDNKGNLGDLNLENFPSSISEEGQVAHSAIEDGQSSLELVERHLTISYDLRFNPVSGRLEFKKKGQPNYELLNDYKFNSIIRELLKKQIKVSKDTLKSIIHSVLRLLITPLFNISTAYLNGMGLTTYSSWLKQLKQRMMTYGTDGS